MMLKLTLRRTGNSIEIVLPKEALDHLGAVEGVGVFVNFLPDGALRLSTADPEFERQVQAAEEINPTHGNAIRALIRRPFRTPSRQGAARPAAEATAENIKHTEKTGFIRTWRSLQKNRASI